MSICKITFVKRDLVLQWRQKQQLVNLQPKLSVCKMRLFQVPLVRILRTLAQLLYLEEQLLHLFKQAIIQGKDHLIITGAVHF